MARVIPSGGQDQTALFVAREAAANDALARMYIMLQAKREDRLAQQEFMREMLNARQEHDWAKTRFLYPDDNSTSSDSPLSISPGASAYTPNGPRPIPNALPGDTAAPLPSDSFQLPASPTSLNGSGPMQADRFASNGDPNDPMNAMAQGSLDQIPPAAKGQARSTNKTGPTLTGMPRQPRTARPQAGFVNIHPTILDQWRQAEIENKLPQGTLLTVLGFENDGGRRYGKNSVSSANGWFQFTDALRKKFNLSEADTHDPVLMGRLAARNMADNRNTLTTLTSSTNKVALGDSVGEIPFYTVLHQFGPGDGSRIVAALKANPNLKMADVMLQNLKNPDGTPRDIAKVLVNNRIPFDATVGDFYRMHRAKIDPWMNKAIISDGQPQQQSQAPQGGAAPSDAVGFLQSRGAGVNVRGLQPDVAISLANAIQAAEAATGARATLTSGHRTGPEQAQLRANYERRPYTYQGVTYQPNRAGGLAAHPGQSRHEGGNAGDIARGPVLDYLHRNPQILAQNGLEFLSGRAGALDRVHVQRIRGWQPQGAATQFASRGAPTNAPTDVSSQATQVSLPSRTPMKGVGKSVPDPTGQFGFKPSPSISPIEAAKDAIFAAPGAIKGGASTPPVARTPAPTPTPAVAPPAAPPQAPPAAIGPEQPVPLPPRRPPMPAPTLAPPAAPDAPPPLMSGGDMGAAAGIRPTPELQSLFNDDGDVLPPPITPDALPPGASKDESGEITVPRPLPRPKGLGPQPNPQSFDMVDEMAGDKMPVDPSDMQADPFINAPKPYVPAATRQADDVMMESINQPQLLEQTQSDMPQELGMGAQLPPVPDTSFDTGEFDAIQPDAYPSIPTPWPEPQFNQSVRASPPDNKYDPGLSREARDAGMQRMLEKLKEVASGAATGARKVIGVPFDDYDNPELVAKTEEKIGGDIREGAEDMLYNAGRSINRGYDAGARALKGMYAGAIPYIQGLYGNAQGNTGAIREAQEFKDKVFTGPNDMGASGFVVGSPESYNRGMPGTSQYVTRDMEAVAIPTPQQEQPTVPTKLSTPSIPNPVTKPDDRMDQYDSDTVINGRSMTPPGVPTFRNEFTHTPTPPLVGGGRASLPSMSDAGSAAFNALRAMRSRLPEGVLDKVKNAIFASGRPKTGAAPSFDPNAPLPSRKVRTVAPNEDVGLQPFSIPKVGEDKKVTGSPFNPNESQAAKGKLPPPPSKSGSSGDPPGTITLPDGRKKIPDSNAPGGFRYVVP